MDCAEVILLDEVRVRKQRATLCQRLHELIGMLDLDAERLARPVLRKGDDSAIISFPYLERFAVAFTVLKYDAW
jgi:hypothetical protein